MFIPWGSLDWALRRYGSVDWTLVGAIAHEDRSLTLLEQMPELASKSFLMKIYDQDPVDAALEEVRLDLKEHEAVKLGVPGSQVYEEDLFAPIDLVESYIEQAMASKNSLIIDISTFPKRWFFVLLRLALENRALENILITYTMAESYAPVLSYNPEVIRTLPTFTSIHRRDSCDVAFISIGFHSYSIMELFNIERPRALRLLFPFPPGPPGIMKNWQFLERLSKTVREDLNGQYEAPSHFEHTQIGALDVANNFELLRRVTDGGAKTSLVAPYGPKPVSLAMCLFALAAEAAGKPEVPVYYSQPTRYSMDYTSGKMIKGGRPVIYGYPVRMKSKDFYRL